MKIKDIHVFMASLVGIFIIPFIISDIFYVDDIYRSISGKGGWTGLGRPLADAVFFPFRPEFGMTVDIAPLTQIIAAICLFFSWMICSNNIFRKNNASTLLATFPIISSPFFVQNLAYRFDSMSMSLAVLTVCLSYNFITRFNKTGLILAILFGFMSLCLYQSAINILIGLSAVHLLTRDSNDRSLLKQAFFFVAVFILSNLIYLLFISLSGINISGKGSIDILGGLESSVKYINYFFDSFGIEDKRIIISLCIPPLLAAIIKTIKHYNNTKSSSGAVIILITPLAGFIAMFGSLPLVAHQDPIPRILTGASATFIYWNISLLILIKAIFKSSVMANRASYILAIQALFFISVPYSFVNAQKKQNTLDVAVAREAVEDIRQVVGSSDGIRITTLGGTPYAHQVYINSYQLPLIKNMVSSMYDFTAYLYLRDMYVKGMYFSFERKKTDDNFIKAKNLANTKVIKKEYCIYRFRNDVYVIFNSKW
ncbi:glucosyltransferase domain-containing protein [Cronobacter dublinensis]|uniref:glucosyltransferase domain-containing protein n=1 Tax=Cronobacter dublinensis TaxID=413497 RepID=UPI001375EF0C|nr:glucosyltransferase domain-containing protein [Cronobacter dublinensis]NCH71995.1 hypothetical protein [Cronobacter dublinensis]